MLYPIEKAEARDGYRLWIRFSDGLEGEVDVSDIVGKGVFEAWRGVSVFRQVSIDPETRTVVWPGGLDLAPDALHAEIHARKAA